MIPCSTWLLGGAWRPHGGIGQGSRRSWLVEGRYRIRTGVGYWHRGHCYPRTGDRTLWHRSLLSFGQEPSNSNAWNEPVLCSPIVLWCSLPQAQEVHDAIRAWVSEKVSAEVAQVWRRLLATPSSIDRLNVTKDPLGFLCQIAIFIVEIISCHTP